MHIIGGTPEGLLNVKSLTPIYNKQVGVASGVETTIVSYTVPSGKEFFVQSILASGNADGEFKFYINGVQKLYGRTSSANREEKNIFGGAVGIKTVTGDILSLTVLQVEGVPEDYEATILGFLESI